MRNTGRCLLLIVTLSICLLMIASCSSSESTDIASIPLEKALSNGKPTLAEFGWRDCIPCKAMKPILEELVIEYNGKVNILIVEVYDHVDLTRQYKVMTIPTQVFFDSNGKEVTRHMGLWLKEEIIEYFKEHGID